MAKLEWQAYKPRLLTRVTANTYAIRVANTVSDLVPKVEKVFGDRLLVVNGHYNKRGYCVGYSLTFEGKPSLLISDFYIVIDYLKKGKRPKQLMFPKLAKQDPSICLVKFGTSFENRMYAFIYRRKKE